MNKLIAVMPFLTVLLACGEKNAETPKGVEIDKPHLSQTSNLGKVEEVEVKAHGTGLTPGSAVSEALRMALAQVNGVRVNAGSMLMELEATTKIDIETNTGMDSVKVTELLKGRGFADQVVSQSKGVVSSFNLVAVTPPKEKGGNYTVEIIAKIPKFKAIPDATKITIVVAPLKVNEASFSIGGKQVSADSVIEPIRHQIIDSLTQSGRFTVLDRQFDNEIQNELRMITSRQTSQSDILKLNQALSADAIWVGNVNSLSYDRHVKKLKSSGREIVSYSGKWSISQRLINLTTREVLLSDTFKGEFPEVSPTLTDSTVYTVEAIALMQAQVVSKATEAINLRIFPISVVSIEGDSVVLSQGQGSLVEGARYKVVKYGKDVKDPKTGKSLGYLESDCCDLEITKVSSNLSYGKLENLKIALVGIDHRDLQIKGKLSTSKDLGKDTSKNSQSYYENNKSRQKLIEFGSNNADIEQVHNPRKQNDTFKEKDW